MIQQEDFWDFRNYGGVPTNNSDKKYAVFIGRYQPFHLGHETLIRQKLKRGIPCLVFVRDINPDSKNPLTTAQTIEIIQAALSGEDVMVSVIPDIESVNFGRGVGYEINEFIPPLNLANISATEIRRQISANESSWMNMVNPLAHELVIKYLRG